MSSNVTWIEHIWETIDLSENLSKTLDLVREVENGMHSFLMAGFSILAFLGTFTLAYIFDLSSSWQAMSHLRELAEVQLKGTSVALYSVYLLAVLTYLPTIFEMLGAKFARFRIRWFQIITIGLSLFDLYTDLPRVREFMTPYYGYFVTADANPLKSLIGWASYYLCFGLWWALASYGFEFLAVLCAVSALCFILKGLAGEGARGGRGRQTGKAVA